mmetsp:Transcript_16596/g.39659  ORF Transcript_16596/g.39659 Transcript_16596/m.39659 type:complete len:420 (+) Transcript_16596:845-2104(+)
MMSYLLLSRSTLMSLSLSSRAAVCRSSLLALSCARNTSVCTLISCCRSSMDICSWNLRFCSPKTSSALALSSSRSRFTSSLSTSVATMPCSLPLTSSLTCRWPASLRISSSAVVPASRADSCVESSSLRFACLRSLESRLHCVSSMARWACCSSSCFVRSAIFLCSSRCSEAERTPVARATLRSMSCSWKSAAYTSSRCRCACSSSCLIRLEALREERSAPEISASMLASSRLASERTSPCLKIFSLSTTSSFSAALSAASSDACSSSTCLADFSRSPVCVRERSMDFSACASFFLALSSLILRVSMSPTRSEHCERVCAISLAALLRVERTTSTWSASSSSRLPSDTRCSRLRPTCRSRLLMTRSTSELFFCSVCRNSSFSLSASCFSRRSRFASANSSCARLMVSSRLCIASTACSH